MSLQNEFLTIEQSQENPFMGSKSEAPKFEGIFLRKDMCMCVQAHFLYFKPKTHSGIRNPNYLCNETSKYASQNVSMRNAYQLLLLSFFLSSQIDVHKIKHPVLKQSNDINQVQCIYAKKKGK